MSVAFILAGFAATALAQPGDEWVFGADAPVAFDRAYTQFKPVVSGDLVFWEDNRPGPDVQNFTRIFYRDLSRPDAREQALTPWEGYFSGAWKDQGVPAADGAVVAWRETVTSESGGRAFEIRFIDTSGGCLARGDCDVQRVPLVSPKEMSPAVSGSRIVWQDDTPGSAESDIYMYETAGGGISPVCAEAGAQQDPDIDGEWAVWVDNRGGTFIRGRATKNDLYVRNVVTGEERRITFDEDVARQGSPAISGDIVVYNEYRSDASTRQDIKAYNIATGETFAVYAGPGTDQRPAIDGRIIVWEACPDGIDSCGVWMHDLDTGVSQPVSAGPQEAGKNTSTISFPSVSSSRIVWQDSREGGRAVYENRLGERARVLAERMKPELRLSRDESFEPEPMELMLDLPGSFLRKRVSDGFEPVRNPEPDALAGLCESADCYVDLMGSAVEAGGGESSCGIDRGLVNRMYRKDYRSRQGDYPPRVYARVKRVGGEGAVIQYWINYVANDHPELFHEGDWEMVQVRLDGDLEPFRADYSQHGSGQWRAWDDVEKTGDGWTHPVVYVAAGSHASYFRTGEFDLVSFFAWDIADAGGPAITPQVEVIPELEEAEGAFSWLLFQGRWGELTGASLCLPGIPGVFDPAGHRDGPPGPAFQGAKWDDPFGWLGDDECDGCEDSKGEGVVLGVSAWVGAEVHVYDSGGRHLGRGSDGATETGIPGSYLLQFPQIGRVFAGIPGGDLSAGPYRVSLTAGADSGVTITVPDRAAGRVETVYFDPVTSSPGARADILLDGSGEYRLTVDDDGDGVADLELLPAAVTSRDVDFTPPAAVTDLSAAAADTGSVALTFTAPGDDGDTGVAAAYDLRYSLTPVSADNWHDATPFTLPAPLPAGETESVVVDGLVAGTTYYFAVRAVDDTALAGPISNVAIVATPVPELAWYKKAAYWKSYADYRSRSLTVDFELRNKGTAMALDTRIEASFGIPANCYAVTPMPMLIGDVGPDEGRLVTIRYHVPDSAFSFVARTYASCRDREGGEHWFPEPLLKT